MEITAKNVEEKREHVQLLIATNKLSDAIRQVLKLLKKSERNSYFEAIVLSMELYNLEQAITTGRITWEQENLYRRKLAFKILKTLDKSDA